MTINLYEFEYLTQSKSLIYRLLIQTLDTLGRLPEKLTSRTLRRVIV